MVGILLHVILLSPSVFDFKALQGVLCINVVQQASEGSSSTSSEWIHFSTEVMVSLNCFNFTVLIMKSAMGLSLHLDDKIIVKYWKNNVCPFLSLMNYCVDFKMAVPYLHLVLHQMSVSLG